MIPTLPAVDMNRVIKIWPRTGGRVYFFCLLGVRVLKAQQEFKQIARRNGESDQI